MCTMVIFFKLLFLLWEKWGCHLGIKILFRLGMVPFIGTNYIRRLNTVYLYLVCIFLQSGAFRWLHCLLAHDFGQHFLLMTQVWHGVSQTCLILLSVKGTWALKGNHMIYWSALGWIFRRNWKICMLCCGFFYLCLLEALPNVTMLNM